MKDKKLNLYLLWVQVNSRNWLSRGTMNLFFHRTGFVAKCGAPVWVKIIAWVDSKGAALRWYYLPSLLFRHHTHRYPNRLTDYSQATWGGCYYVQAEKKTVQQLQVRSAQTNGGCRLRLLRENVSNGLILVGGNIWKAAHRKFQCCILHSRAFCFPAITLNELYTWWHSVGKARNEKTRDQCHDVIVMRLAWHALSSLKQTLCIEMNLI